MRVRPPPPAPNKHGSYDAEIAGATVLFTHLIEKSWIYMTSEKEKRFLLLLSSTFCGVGASKSDVLNYISSNEWLILSDKDKMIKRNRNELVWRNDLAFIRKHLAQEGLFVDGIRNNWSITDSGKLYLNELMQEVLNTETLSKISPKLVHELKNGKFTI